MSKLVLAPKLHQYYDYQELKEFFKSKGVNIDLKWSGFGGVNNGSMEYWPDIHDEDFEELAETISDGITLMRQFIPDITDYPVQVWW